MLEMDFQFALDAIIGQTPQQRQTLLFSATFPAQIKSITKNIMENPVMAKVSSRHDETIIKQHFYKVNNEKQRLTALRLLLLQHRPESTVVFCNTIREVQQIADNLTDDGFSVLALHGDLEQRDRDQTLVRFANKSISVLVATDVAARGLDINAIDLVINYHIARDTEVHVHRIGRTGRAGESGHALSLVSADEGKMLAGIERLIKKQLPRKSMEGFEPTNNLPLKPKAKADPSKARGRSSNGSGNGRPAGKPHSFGAKPGGRSGGRSQNGGGGQRSRGARQDA